jgi:hypothetical protein
MGCRASSRVRIPLTPPVRQDSHASGGLLSFWAQCFRGFPAGGRNRENRYPPSVSDASEIFSERNVRSAVPPLKENTRAQKRDCGLDLASPPFLLAMGVRPHVRVMPQPCRDITSGLHLVARGTAQAQPLMPSGGLKAPRRRFLAHSCPGPVPAVIEAHTASWCLLLGLMQMRRPLVRFADLDIGRHRS